MRPQPFQQATFRCPHSLEPLPFITPLAPLVLEMTITVSWWGALLVFEITVLLLAPLAVGLGTLGL